METAAQVVLAYVNSQIGESEYNGMALREAFLDIIDDADENTRKGWMSSVTLKDGYSYYVSCASLEETYRTDLFNQGKTALIAAVLASDQCGIRSYIWVYASLRVSSAAKSAWCRCSGFPAELSLIIRIRVTITPLATPLLTRPQNKPQNNSRASGHRPEALPFYVRAFSIRSR